MRHYFVCKNQVFKTVFSLLLLSFLVACGDNIQVENDYDPKFNFKAIKSYSFVEFVDDDVTRLMQNRVEQALSDKMAALNYQESSAEQADILVAFHLITKIKQRQRVTTTDPGFDYYGRRYYGPSINMSVSHIDTIDYKVGSLIIDFIDPDSRNVVYHAGASAILSDVKTPDERMQLIRAAVDKALQEYPPTSL